MRANDIAAGVRQSLKTGVINERSEYGMVRCAWMAEDGRLGEVKAWDDERVLASLPTTADRLPAVLYAAGMIEAPRVEWTKREDTSGCTWEAELIGEQFAIVWEEAGAMYSCGQRGQMIHDRKSYGDTLDATRRHCEVMAFERHVVELMRGGK